MPRANTPKHLKSYEITCEGRGPTREMALHILEIHVKHQCAWIKGNPVKDDILIVEGLSGEYVATQHISFIDNRYKKDDEETNNDLMRRALGEHLDYEMCGSDKPE